MSLDESPAGGTAEPAARRGRGRGSGRRRESIEAGAIVAARELRTITGARVAIPDPDRLVHLQFRRFAGCPVCDLHLHAFTSRRDDLARAGVREVILFHSTEDALREYAGDIPFDVVADPDKRLYTEFGVESSPRALLDPRVWPTIARAVLRSAWRTIRERRPLPPIVPRGGRTGLPADFLIAPDGRVVASKYGAHASDQWSVDELLAIALGCERIVKAEADLLA